MNTTLKFKNTTIKKYQLKPKNKKTNSTKIKIQFKKTFKFNGTTNKDF